MVDFCLSFSDCITILSNENLNTLLKSYRDFVKAGGDFYFAKIDCRTKTFAVHCIYARSTNDLQIWHAAVATHVLIKETILCRII